MWDLECKIKNTSIWKLMGVTKPTTLPGSYTVVLDEPEKMIEDVSNHLEFPTLKLKVNKNDLHQI